MIAQDFADRQTSHWNATWQSLRGQPGDAALLHALVARHSEPHRHYHTLDHLDACLRHLPALRGLATYPDEVALALWFHDAIYDIDAVDNERRSADWAYESLSAARVDAVFIQL